MHSLMLAAEADSNYTPRVENKPGMRKENRNGCGSFMRCALANASMKIHHADENNTPDTAAKINVRDMKYLMRMSRMSELARITPSGGRHPARTRRDALQRLPVHVTREVTST